MEVLYGSTGTGKTRYVHQQAHLFYEDDIWIYPGQGWFDGYQGQQVVVFDDFYGDMPFGTLLKVLDRYKLDVPVKGGFTNWNPTRIYITSNVHPLCWYKDLNNHQEAALLRRFDREYFIDSNIFE